MSKKIHRIVLTGGPCGGKTTALIAIAERLEESGLKVIIGFEGATALILNRVSPPKMGTPLFQRILFDFEVVKAEWLERTAGAIASEFGQDVAIIHDRTWLDAKAYTDPADWERLIAGFDPAERTRAGEWCVIHLTTAADGAEDFYTLENNQARFESAEEARGRDRLLVDAYQHFEHRFPIDNRGPFSEKVRRAVEAACRFVSIPEPLEIERWFEVESFDQDAVDACRPVKIEISQFYLPDGSRFRRRKLPDGSHTFSRTWKREIGQSGVRAETSVTLGAFEFGQAWELNRDAPRVHKTRQVFDFGGQRWELDEFQKPTGRIKLEAETPTREDSVDVPSFIKVRREVTSDNRWSNAYLATLP